MQVVIGGVGGVGGVAVLAILGATGCGRLDVDTALATGAQAVCDVHDAIDSCGPACEACPAANARELPTCDGTACNTACVAATPRCSDHSCSQLTWSFDAGSLEGITPLSPDGLVLDVRSHNGSPALAIDVTDLFIVSFTIPICLSGTAALDTRTLTAHVLFDGPPSGSPQYFMQTSVPAPMNGAYLSTIDLASATDVVYSAPINLSQFAGAASTIVVQAGTLGEQFSGTLWFDDIEIR